MNPVNQKNSMKLLLIILLPLLLAFSGTSLFSKTGSAEGDALIWVQKPDDTVSCEEKSGMSLEFEVSELKRVGVTVVKSEKGHDGQIRIQMCGVPTGGLNRAQIHKRDLDKAAKVGFKPAE